MAYNLRLIEYPNGSTQVRVYAQPMSDVRIDNFRTERLREPFSDALVGDMDKQADNRYESAARARRKVSMYARATSWDWFLTLTFSPEKSDRYDFRRCTARTQWWLRYMRKTRAPDLQYLIVYEPHADGAWHIHGLMANTGTLDFKISGHRRHGRQTYNLINWRYGYSACTVVQDTHKVAAYIVKYITKADIELDRWQHRYLVSRNLPKPRQSLYAVEPQDVDAWIAQYASQTGQEIRWVSSSPPGGYVDVTYYDLAPDSGRSEDD